MPFAGHRLPAAWRTTPSSRDFAWTRTETAPSIAPAHDGSGVTATAALTTEDEALLAMCEAGQWFMKHRKKGDWPHRRFVYTSGGSICWSKTEDRGGREGRIDGPSLQIVPGAITAVFATKKRVLQDDRRNRLFSVIGAERTLDLEAASEGERHQWVRALSAFVRQQAATASASAAAEAALGPNGPKDACALFMPSTLGVGVGAALGGGLFDVRGCEEGGSAPRQAQPARPDASELGSAVHFPEMRGSFRMLTGSIARRWASLEIELAHGELSAAGRGALPLRHVVGIGIHEEEQGPSPTAADAAADAAVAAPPPASKAALTPTAAASGSTSERTQAAAPGAITAPTPPTASMGELRLRLRLGTVSVGGRGSAGGIGSGFGGAATAITFGPSRDALQMEPPADVRLRAPAAVVRAWHSAVVRSMALMEDLDLAVASSAASSTDGTREARALAPPPPAQLQPLRRETLEIELNRLFEGAFEGCATDARAAIDGIPHTDRTLGFASKPAPWSAGARCLVLRCVLGLALHDPSRTVCSVPRCVRAVSRCAALDPLLEASLIKLSVAATSLPPRPDLFSYYAEGIHARLCNLYQVRPYDMPPTHANPHAFTRIRTHTRTRTRSKWVGGGEW